MNSSGSIFRGLSASLRQFSLLMLIAVLISCSSNVKQQGQLVDTVPQDTQHYTAVAPSTPRHPPQANEDSLLLTRAKEILVLIRNSNFKSLADHIHPKLGVRFSPYAHIDTAADVRLTKEKFLRLVASQQRLTWGNYDGSGGPIDLSIQDYFKKFVYNADFLHPEKFSINKMMQQGNVASNLQQVYTNCNFVESYFSGFDKKYEGMDWCALRLVFMEYEGKQYLVGIVHAQWTT